MKMFYPVLLSSSLHLKELMLNIFFRVKKEVSSHELLDLTLKVTDDFCDFCDKNNISLNFERIYIFLNR